MAVDINTAEKKSEQDAKEGIPQNKIALSVFFMATLLAIITLILQSEPIHPVIKYLSTSVLSVPAIFFSLYLLFLPLKYKSNDRYLVNTIFPCSKTYVSNEFIDYWYDLGANWLPLSLSNVLTNGLFWCLVIASNELAFLYISLNWTLQIIIYTLITNIPGIIFILMIRHIQRSQSIKAKRQEEIISEERDQSTKFVSISVAVVFTIITTLTGYVLNTSLLEYMARSS